MIRPLTETDRAELVRMRVALWPDSLEAEVDQIVAASSNDTLILVAEREGGGSHDGLCGFAEIGSRIQAEGCDSSPIAYLEGIWVDPDCRRSGTATKLVDEAKRWAASTGFREFASDCSIENVVSQAFHEAAGFIEVGRAVCFRMPLGQVKGE